MERFTTLTSLAAPLRVANVDTDVITPMKRLTGGNTRPLADYAFEAWRYDGGDADTGAPRPDFALNDPRYAGAAILLTGENFGCGSSRESAPQAIRDLGFRCLIGTSFGDIFFNNCFQRGILPIVVDAATLDRLAGDCGPLTVDLATCTVTTSSGDSIAFAVNALRRESLLEGLDDIELTRKRERLIAAWQAADRTRRPWVYDL